MSNARRLRGFRSILPELALGLLTLTSCHGSLSGGTSSGETPASPDAPSKTSPKPGGAGSGGQTPIPPSPPDRPGELSEFFNPASASRPVGRLGRDQLDAVARDFFKVSLTTTELAVLPSGGGTDVTVSSSKYAEGMWSFARLVGARAFAAGGALSGFCGSKALTGLPCAKKLVEEVGTLLFQRAPTTEEIDAFADHFSKSEGLPESEALSLVLQAMLVSPTFLYPAERRPAGATSDHFKLSRLTLSLWDSLPDAPTVARHADDARVGKVAVVDALLADARAERFFRKVAFRFADVRQIGDLQKAEALAAKFGASVQAALEAELYEVLAGAFQASGDSFTTLMTSTRLHVNKDSAPIYGLGSTSSALEPRDARPEERRAGLLTNGALLAIESTNNEGSAVKRGILVLSRLLCAPPPPPPANVPTLEEIKTEGLTQREKLAIHGKAPGCIGCHDAIDGIGLGLENYDAIGRHVVTDHGKPLTGAGKVPALMGSPAQTYSGAAELGALLAKAPQARECFVKQVHLSLSGRPSFGAERADLERARKRFVDTGSVRGLVGDLLTADATSMRF